MSQVERHATVPVPALEMQAMLIHDLEKCAQVQAGRLKPFLGLRPGTLRVWRDRMQWQRGSKPAVDLPGVTAVEFGPRNTIRVDYQGADGPATAFLVTPQEEYENLALARARFQLQLRTALSMESAGSGEEPGSDREAAATLATLDLAKAEGKVKTARIHMWVGGVLAVIGLLVTIITASAASGGGTYVIMWGAMLFGVLWFVLGVFEYRSATRSVAEAKTSLPS